MLQGSYIRLWYLDNVKKDGKSKVKNTERTKKLKTIAKV